MIDVGTRVSWTTRGPYGRRQRHGTVTAFVAAGQPLPAHVTATRAADVNTVHDRYLVAVVSASGRVRYFAPRARELEAVVDCGHAAT